ncbi:colicin immunity domain-containing protein [Pseudomonas xantholysinigenes]|uniref:Colicin-D n=1 Tax=Pseudomonas xantholysinigenes TaxID=2745490 RepID=A0A9E6PU96_9PSED|nr:colicin immunity domain-containing protein [Pseudomonas xantholysinigenes]QXI36596.1 colicin-D [Pseudomonas xantholysinigenes]
MSSHDMISLGKDLINGKIDGLTFSEDICVARRDKTNSTPTDRNILNCGEELFMAAETYNPNEDREDYEINEEQLKMQVSEILNKYNISTS